MVERRDAAFDDDDGFIVFNEGTAALGGAQDIDAWVGYFQAAEPAGIAMPPLNRIVAPA